MLAAAAAAGLATLAGTGPGRAQEASPSPATVSADGTKAVWVKFNLNTATEEQLRTIPGIGDRMVGEFQEYRPYTSINQFRQEIGKYVDANQVAAYEAYVFVPIDPSAADADTLKQLPGVDDDIATALAAGRPYADGQAFLTALAGHVSPEQAALAAAYLATS